MLLATLLALGAAVMHAGWNLAVKQSGDRFIALWGQFFMAGVIATVVLAVFGGVSPAAYGWAAIGALAHVPYAILLTRAYDLGDFSQTYPIARGGGALLAGLGGLAILGDHLAPVGVVGMVVVALGLLALGSGRAAGLGSAIGVAVAIATYSVADAHAVRSTHSPLYAAATNVGTMLTITAAGVAQGRGRQMYAALRAGWPRFTLFGIVVGGTYAMVQVAFRFAPVGYVTCLRESSVVLAAIVGVRLLGERGGHRRVTAALVVALGLVLLVLGR